MMRLRFAPSPTGLLHVGNARTALFNWLLARGHQGRFVLRIEDTDRERSTAASEASIIEDLRWLGLAWDEGPDVGGDHGPYRQSERLDLYHEHARRLMSEGKAYYCFCTPEEIEQDRADAVARGDQPRYSRRCASIEPDVAAARVAAGERAAIRFLVPDGPDIEFEDIVRGYVSFARQVIGDPVIVRSDGHPAYNFAVVVDDALMGITHVIRGEDHVSNTPRQLLLYYAFGYTPPRFAHLALVLGPDHTPLSKRHGATSVSEFRARGYLPEALVNYLALLGWSPGQDQEILPIDDMTRRFAIEDVGKSAGVFDPDKLAWMNRHYLKNASPRRLAALLAPYVEASGFGRAIGPRGVEYLEAHVVPMVAGSVNRLDDAVARVRFLFNYDASQLASRADVRREFDAPEPRRVLAAVADELRPGDRLVNRDAFRSMASRVREHTGQKGRSLFHPIRVIVTGEADGPELDVAVPAIDAGAQLPPDAGLAPIVGCRERAVALAAALGVR